jgi:DNA (cytosine-5)-methyltransferase 1
MSLRALDLYCGIGGWSLGLRAAGINVVGSYEIWPDAVATYNANLAKRRRPADVRTLDLQQLPKNIDLVVGSPPCTEFSFSNKGGGGDFVEGLKDIVRFLEIVRFLRPKYWVLENVPRTALVIEQGLKTAGHPLYPFRSLKPQVKIIDFSKFGLPQSRRRCLVGNFPFGLLDTYVDLAKARTLGDVVSSLAAADTVVDPVWGGSMPRTGLSEMEPEPPLDAEQLRMNREAKRFHPVYNDMSFPDRLDTPSRTVTATCTRVSRESIVIRNQEDGRLRRLTVRERASLQGFPISYQFFAKSHSTKVKMIGNAVPPLFSFFAGMASREKSVKFAKAKLKKLEATGLQLKPTAAPVFTPPHSVSDKFPEGRRFRAALPGLRFKSGMRFELANEFKDADVQWRIRFFFGPSKDIKTIDLNRNLLRSLRMRIALRPIVADLDETLSAVEAFLTDLSPEVMQQSWTRRIEAIGPYQVVDLIGLAAAELAKTLALIDSSVVAEIALKLCGASCSIDSQGSGKIKRNANQLIAGFLVGSFFNQSICAGAKSYSRRTVSTALDTRSCKTMESSNSGDKAVLSSSRFRPEGANWLQLSGGIA